LGASTGFMVAARGNWPRLVRQAGAISLRAIELSALSAPELPGLMRFLSGKSGLPFDFVSVHAPSKGIQMSWSDLSHSLARLPRFVDAIVVHPETVDEPTTLRQLGSRLALENMDARKTNARTPDELEVYFKLLPEARFCLDVAHAASLDSSMDLANRLLARFGDRLTHVHISGLTPNGKHRTATDDEWRQYASILERCKDAPWILEAPL
jgi:hypothetical protein